MSSDVNQTDILEGYEKLLEEVEEIRKQDVGLAALENISKVMDVAAKLVDKASKPQEIGIDAKVLEGTSIVIQQNAEKFDAVFKPEEFCDKTIKFLMEMGVPASSQSESIIWKNFCIAFGSLLPICPKFSFMLGTFDYSGYKPKERAQRQGKKKNLMSELVKALPEKGGTQESSQSLQLDILAHLKICLANAYKENGNKPVPYYKFVLNPDSFEETCQNILHVSFLVKDSFVTITFGDDRLEPFLSPLKQPKESQTGLQKEEAKRQLVIQLNHEQWKGLLEVYDVKQPIIKPLPQRKH